MTPINLLVLIFRMTGIASHSRSLFYIHLTLDCAKNLNVDRTTVSKIMKKGVYPFLLENKRA